MTTDSFIVGGNVGSGNKRFAVGFSCRTFKGGVPQIEAYALLEASHSLLVKHNMLYCL